jgi:hypothetical protein
MNESNAYKDQMVAIFREKKLDGKAELLNTLLDYLLQSAGKTGVLDVSPFLVGCFMATPGQEESDTANMMSKTNVFELIPELKDKKKFHQLIEKKQLNTLVEIDSEVKEITLFFDLEMLVRSGNEEHGRFKGSHLTKLSVFQMMKRVIDYL